MPVVLGSSRETQSFQAAFDPLLTPGSRNYWKSHDFLALPDELIDTLLEYVRTMPDPQCEVFIAQMGGATNRVPANATAYPHRDTAYIMTVHGRWDDPAADEQSIAWCRELFGAAAPHATGGVSVNFMTEAERERVPSAYGECLQRQREVKRAYDPGNLFRMNQNIPPAD